MTGAALDGSSEPVLVLISILVWPATILFGIHLLGEPIADIARGIARRAVRFSVFQIEVELAPLAPPPPAFDVALGQLRDAVVATSGPGPLIEGVSLGEGADFVSLDLGEEGRPRWLTSRLFLLAALLERSRTVRAIVLLEGGRRFLGVARPADLRAELASRFPRYEAEFAEACLHAVQTSTAHSSRSDAFVRDVVQQFLTPGIGVVDFPSPEVDEPKVKLERDGDIVFEHASWLTSGKLRAMLGPRLTHGVVRGGDGGGAARTRAIVRACGAFVALVDASGAFAGLCDRAAVNEQIARIAVERTDVDDAAGR